MLINHVQFFLLDFDAITESNTVAAVFAIKVCTQERMDMSVSYG